MRVKLIITALLTIGIITGCESVRYINPVLPDYQVAIPERPTLKNVEGEVPKEATDNLISMIAYAEKLEIVCQGWESFYAGLKEIYNVDIPAD